MVVHAPALQPHRSRFAGFALAGHEFALEPGGALYWPREAALIVADLHLEKASWFARHGQMLPPYDSRATLERLEAVLKATDARRVFCLGDSFHDPQGPARLEPQAADLLAALARRVEFVWIAGNHDTAHGTADPVPAGGAIPAAAAESLTVAKVALVHEAKPGQNGPQISGHFHPRIAIAARGRRIVRPCAVRGGQRLVLPAFGALAGGLAAGDPAIRAALHPADAIDALSASQGRIAVWPL